MELTLLPVRNPLWNFSLHHAKFDVELLTLGVEVHVGVRTLYRESPGGVFVDFTWSPRCFGADFALAQLSIHVKPMKTTGVRRRVRRLPCGVLLFPRGVQVETWSSHSPAGIPHFCCGIRTLRTFHVEPSWNSTFQCGIQLEFHFSMCGLRTEFTPKSAETPWTPRGIHKDSTWTFTVKSANSNEKVNTRECEVRR